MVEHFAVGKNKEKRGRGRGNERLRDDLEAPGVYTQMEIIRGIERRVGVPMSIWPDLAPRASIYRTRGHAAQRGNMDDALMIEHRC